VGIAPYGKTSREKGFFPIPKGSAPTAFTIFLLFPNLPYKCKDGTIAPYSNKQGDFDMKKCLLWALALMMMLSAATAMAAAQEKTVVTSFYPIYALTRNLTEGVEGIEVVNLAAPNTGCLHDYQLLTGDMRTLSSAQAFLINGAGMESYLDTVAAQFPQLQVVDASQGIPLLEEDGQQALVLGQQEDAANAHIWLDVKNAMKMVENLRNGLQSVFPDQAEAIGKNAESYLARLSALDAELTQGLANLPHKDIVTFHEAFPYFANAYGLHVAAVVTHEPGEALSPAQLAELTRTEKDLGLPPLFTEPQYPDLAARTLAAETGAKMYALDPLVTGPLDDGSLTAYEDGMRKNMQILTEALGEQK
jgi:zinc transport system substrate-binding protein